MSEGVAPNPRPGMVLGERYRLGRHLGDGRSGSVFSAKDTTTGEAVAVKLLHKPLCSVEEQVRRFAREFELTSQIDHPSVVGMYAFGEQGEGPLKGRHYLVMELLQGRGLDVLLQEGVINPARAVSIGAEVAGALAAAHALHVVHRDVKPGNIYIHTKRGVDHVKVLDFGLARLQGGGDDLTDFGIRLGTAQYMSPEYISRSDLSEASDMYAFGVTLFEMLVGRPPFTGRSMAVMAAHVKEPSPRPSGAASGIPGWLDDLVVALLAKEPDQRPVADEVSRILSEHRPKMKEARGPTRASSAPVASAPEGAGSVSHLGEMRAPVYPESPSPLRSTGVIVSLGLAGLALLFASMVFGVLLVLWLQA